MLAVVDWFCRKGEETSVHNYKVWNFYGVGDALAVCVCGAECSPNI